MAQLREALEKKRRADEAQHGIREAFMARDIQPEVFDRLSRVVKAAAERGEREVLVLRFSSEYCTDGGRAINSLEADWPQTLTGFAKRAHEFWEKELAPQGYKLQAQIMDFSRRHAGRRRHLPQMVSSPRSGAVARARGLTFGIDPSLHSRDRWRGRPGPASPTCQSRRAAQCSCLDLAERHPWRQPL